MSEVKTISWLELFGNKVSKALHPAMTSDRGYIKQQRTRRLSDGKPGIYNVVYDKDYLSEYLFVKVCKPLFVLGKERVLELVENSWDLYYGDNPVVIPSKRKAS